MIKTNSLRAIRWVVIFGISAFFAVSIWSGKTTGTICAFTIFGIPFNCPLGVLQGTFSGSLPSKTALVGVASVILVTMLLGRVFCGWICSALLFKKNIPVTKPTKTTAEERRIPYYVLGGALLSTFIVGFPVFCVICPVGLFFASVLAIAGLFTSLKFSWGIILFPFFLYLELRLFRKWCSSICPLGALIKIFSKANIFLKPAVDNKSCLAKEDSICGKADTLCSENIIVKKPDVGASMTNCTKCMDCVAGCPGKAIHMRLMPKKK